MSARRLVVIALSIASAALVAWLGPGSPSTSRSPGPRDATASWPTLTWGGTSSERRTAEWAWSRDAGVGLGDAAAPGSEAEVDRTGRVGAEIGARICPRAARVMCIALERQGCRPLSTEDALYPEGEPPLSCVERLSMSCEDWAHRTYADAPDLLVLDDAALASCLVALTLEATEAVGSVSLDPSCSDVAVNPSPTGDRCDVSQYRCAGGDCVAQRCVPRPREDQPCDQGQCAAGLVCVGAICGRPPPRLGAVEEGAGCASCDLDEECGRGRFCDGAWTVEGGDCRSSLCAEPDPFAPSSGAARSAGAQARVPNR